MAAKLDQLGINIKTSVDKLIEEIKKLQAQTITGPKAGRRSTATKSARRTKK
jgi:hypothetical protein